MTGIGFTLALLASSTLAIASPPATTRPAAPILFLETFDDANLLKRGWYDGDRSLITAGSIEYAWRDGGTTPFTSAVARRLFDPTDEVYIRFEIRLSRNWAWTNRNYHPHLIQFLTTENHKYAGPAATHLTLYVEAVNGRLRLAAQDIQNKDAPHGLTQGPLKGGFNGELYDTDERLFADGDDRWHTIEAYFKLNTLDVPRDRPNGDGVARAWFDGNLVIDHNDVIYRSSDFPGMKINQLLIAPYFGPKLLPHAQTLWLDELTVAPAKPPTGTTRFSK